MLDLPAEERIKYSAFPCPRCGWHHAWGDFKPPLRPKVRVIGSPCYPPRDSRTRPPIGAIGTVTEVRQYEGPMYCRVSFVERQGFELTFENFYPCDLEPA